MQHISIQWNVFETTILYNARSLDYHRISIYIYSFDEFGCDLSHPDQGLNKGSFLISSILLLVGGGGGLVLGIQVEFPGPKGWVLQLSPEVSGHDFSKWILISLFFFFPREGLGFSVAVSDLVMGGKHGSDLQEQTRTWDPRGHSSIDPMVTYPYVAQPYTIWRQLIPSLGIPVDHLESHR